MSLEEKEAAKSRSDKWLACVRALWGNSGLFHMQQPQLVLMTEYIYETLITKFAIVIFEHIFHSVESISFEEKMHTVITKESNFLYIFIIIECQI